MSTFCTAACNAGDWTLDKGFVGTDIHYYPFDGAAGQTHGSTALISQLELHDSFTGGWLARITPFGRVDPTDSRRNTFDLREAELDFSAAAWRFALGSRRVSWSVTESVNIVPFQVVDILNQRDLAGDPAGQEKMGCAMVTGTYQGDSTLVELYLLPWFRTRPFPDTRTREQPFRGAIDLNGAAHYASSAGNTRLGWAARVEHSFDSANVAFIEYQGYEPQPLIAPNFATGKSTELYYLIDMSAVTVQATLGKWLLKTETAYFNTGLNPVRTGGIPGNYWTGVSGFEYTFARVLGDSDLGVIAEWMHDSRGNGPQGTPFTNDVFVGVRWVPNDQADSQFLGGVLRGLDQRAAVIQLQYQRRIGTQWRLGLVLRGYTAQKASPLSAFNEDELLQVNLHYFF